MDDYTIDFVIGSFDNYLTQLNTMEGVMHQFNIGDRVRCKHTGTEGDIISQGTFVNTNGISTYTYSVKMDNGLTYVAYENELYLVSLGPNNPNYAMPNNNVIGGVTVSLPSGYTFSNSVLPNPSPVMYEFKPGDIVHLLDYSKTNGRVSAILNNLVWVEWDAMQVKFYNVNDLRLSDNSHSMPQHSISCECGAQAVNSRNHSNWCPLDQGLDSA
jgi:hypothetical protein